MNVPQIQARPFVGAGMRTTERVGQYAANLLQTDYSLQEAALSYLEGKNPSAHTATVNHGERASDLITELFNSRVSGKVATARIAMHLNKAWRDGFFRQLDELLDPEEWEPEDRPVSDASFRTFLRTIIHLGATRRPGIGATADGELIASWRRDDARLVIINFANDRVGWSISRVVDGEKEVATGKASSVRLPQILTGFECEKLYRDDD